jgi:hypothetical protein
MASAPPRALKCPLCHRDVAPAPTPGANDSERARGLFIEHVTGHHQASELDALLHLAEALRRAG